MMPKEQCEILLGNLLPFAEDQLKKYGEFFPFGAVLTMDDEVAAISYYDDNNDRHESTVVIENLVRGARNINSEGKIKASGIVWNASVTSPDGKPSDAIIVSLEHKDGYSVIVGKPYKIGLFKKVKFGDLVAMEGKHDIF